MSENVNKCFNCKMVTDHGKMFSSGYLCDVCKEKIKKIFELTAESIEDNSNLPREYGGVGNFA